MIVTTTARPTEAQAARAAAVGARTGWPVVPRRGSLRGLVAEYGLVYVVGRDRESIAAEGGRVAVDLGMLHAHRAVGAAHPLIRSVGDASVIVDGTLGLCHDALHLAAVTGARVIGLEVSGALACLAEEGLARLASTEPAAARVTVEHADSRARLATLTADAVLLSPMFDEPRASAPGFDVLRRLAVGQPLDEGWLGAALTAAPRVVVKVRRGQRVPSFARDHLRQVRRGRAVDYWTLVRARLDGA